MTEESLSRHQGSGQPGWSLPGLVPGSLVGAYRVEAPIGSGGMAVVFRARDEALGRTVALKILAPALAGDAEFRERFIRESRAVAAVDHPHIVPVYAAGEAGGVLYLAMRFISGGDLRSVGRREGPLPGDRAVFLLSPIAAALDAAHAVGLVHRDVKPANILIDVAPRRGEHPYLSDFGLAKGTTSAVGLTSAGQFLGTPDYAAPEQIGGKPARPQTDQYALACVAFTVLTGKLPFARNESMAVLWAQMYEPPPPVTAYRPDLPAAVDGVLARALAKSPQDRYATCEDFIGALRAAVDSGHRAFPGAGDPRPGGSAQQRPGRGSPLTVAGRGPVRSAVDPASPYAEGTPQDSARDDQAGRTIPSPPRVGQHAPVRRRFLRPAAIALTLLIGAGAYLLWPAGQNSYYIGEQGGKVAIFRGASLTSESTLAVSMLGADAEDEVARSPSESSLDAAEAFIEQLNLQATNCGALWKALATWQTKSVSYQAALVARAIAEKNKEKVNALSANPGPEPAAPDASACAPATAFGIPESALPGASPAAVPTHVAASTAQAAG